MSRILFRCILPESDDDDHIAIQHAVKYIVARYIYVRIYVTFFVFVSDTAHGSRETSGEMNGNNIKPRPREKTVEDSGVFVGKKKI